MTETPKFAAALAELEQIVAEIESDHVDLDELADKVDRASVLVKLCRDKIGATQLRVRSIIEGLEDGDS